jgi:hypothetical protein
VSCALQSQGIDSEMTPASVMAVAVATPGVHCENLALGARVLLLSCCRRCTAFCALCPSVTDQWYRPDIPGKTGNLCISAHQLQVSSLL